MTAADQTASLIAQRLEDGMRVLDSLLAAKPLPFDDQLSGSLPKQHGVYAICVRGAQPGDVLRAGRTTIAAEGLHQRVYRNHFMGNQKGNLLSQLEKDGACADHAACKDWVRQRCTVQFVVIEDYDARKWAECFVLALLRPKYTDKEPVV